MKALAISYKGMEDITALEIKELIKKDSIINESCVEFECSIEELAKYCYKAQGVNRVLVLLGSFKIKDLSDLKRISKIDFSEFLDKNKTYDEQSSSTFKKAKLSKTFAARCQIIENELDSKEVEIATGDEIEAKVNLKNPDVTIFVYIYKNNCYVGIDFSGDISKRTYKISLGREDVKGTIAYALVRLSGYDSSKSFVNLNSKSGTIAIEAALFGSGKSAHYYDKDFPFLKFLDIDLKQFDNEIKEVDISAFDSFSYLDMTKKNSKVAGVKLHLGKTDKLEKINQTQDCIVRYEKGKAKVSNLKKERKINHGKGVLKIVSFISK